ncbi:RNA 2'-phosphotransferase [Gynurincola endophyticus]|uniref:RNA 2'-phosphotransferase n=1 Tax=Gynurincola endophyticus TaxID=2479004 RepID=UPI000F8E0A14|nr:RNA 2'-phosphotransferase [Gynurincola endophyticus]
MTPKQQKTISKFLSYVLRHHPEQIQLQLDENGWAEVGELIIKSQSEYISFDKEQLEEIVASNDKKRFVFNEDHSKIRANQGHSIEIDLALTTQQPPELLYHGTAAKNIDSIKTTGIQKRNRQQVHLSADKETALKVGSRHGKPVILVIDAGKMYADGISFYISANGVWLTDYVAPEYIL